MNMGTYVYNYINLYIFINYRKVFTRHIMHRDIIKFNKDEKLSYIHLRIATFSYINYQKILLMKSNPYM